MAAEKKGHIVMPANTPLNIQYLRSALSSPNEIHLAELPFNSTQHGLPSNIENTEKLPFTHIAKLFLSTLSLEAPLCSLISQITEQEGHPPLCVISDVFLGWVNNIRNLSFTTCGAHGTLAYVSIWEFFIPQTALSMKSDGWICNTVEEIEPLGLHLLRNYLQLPVWPVGPLLPPASLSGSKHRAGKEPGIALEACMEWLDLKDENYVLYISFGSQNTIRASQMMALAEGLEESGRSFIWVIWPPFGFDINGEFIAECCGVPMIGWPLAAEQAYNVKMLVEEMGVAVELTRTVETVISGEQVKKVIEIVMEQEGKGKEMKEKANEIAAHLREAITEKGKEKGSLVRAMDDLVRAILSPKAK
ncbi:UDP-glycosyltransferase 92A1 [Glycine soja]|uniref:UDP-glycosyltransferase 92A1 n=1 Tax=Glycine soja TaxID=3848 RepID=A0A0B2RYJ0_GLYSO|nr:UDP-glycosyltransferase 92A1 [Glycine soja]